jgi:hypothetical protein
VSRTVTRDSQDTKDASRREGSVGRDTKIYDGGDSLKPRWMVCLSNERPLIWTSRGCCRIRRSQGPRERSHGHSYVIQLSRENLSTLNRQMKAAKWDAASCPGASDRLLHYRYRWMAHMITLGPLIGARLSANEAAYSHAHMIRSSTQLLVP